MVKLTVNNNKLELYNEDCFKVFSKLKDESIDLAVIDSPYGISFTNGHVKTDTKWDTFNKQEYIDFSKKWLKEIYRVLKPNGTCWSFFGRTMIEEWLEIIKDSGFTNNYENWTTYARSKGRASKKKLKSLAEECFHLTKNKNYIWNALQYLRIVVAPYREAGGKKRGWDFGWDEKTCVRLTGLGNIIPIFTSLEDDTENRRGTVLDIGSGSRLPLTGDIYNLQFPVVPSVLNTMEKQVHSAQKAILILSMLIMLSSNEGDTVLDCFGGSFSTGAASALCNRNFIGIEQNKETFDKGVDFIKNFKWEKWERYIKNHIASDEKFKFGLDNHPYKTHEWK